MVVPPGTYVFSATYNGMVGMIMTIGDAIDVRFTVETGHEYEIRPRTGGSKWTAEVFDLTSNTAVRYEIIPTPRAAL